MDVVFGRGFSSAEALDALADAYNGVRLSIRFLFIGVNQNLVRILDCSNFIGPHGVV